MCGRYSLFADRDDLAERFALEFPDGFEWRKGIILRQAKNYLPLFNLRLEIGQVY